MQEDVTGEVGIYGYRATVRILSGACTSRWVINRREVVSNR